MTLTRKLQELEKQLDERDSKVNTMQRSNQTDGVELLTLRKACQLQKQDLENMETKLEEFRHEIERTRYFYHKVAKVSQNVSEWSENEN